MSLLKVSEITDLTGNGSVYAPGHVVQVQSTTKTDTFSASVATGAISGDITGLTAAITPSATSSQVLITGSVVIGCGSGQLVGVSLYRDGSALTAANGVIFGNRRGIISGGQIADATQLVTLSFSYLDSPASTSARAYSLRIVHSSSVAQTVYCNRTGTDTDSSAFFRSQSTITAMEIAQ